ncbi:hypothetical protein AB0K08_13400 [Citricoccus sp. NPDC055426]|uniref:hypothetical protein n=1 Tax=Citricoccus sp. NPDC055426 TaxID=3155536 RepID=UPI00343DBF68
MRTSSDDGTGRAEPPSAARPATPPATPPEPQEPSSEAATSVRLRDAQGREVAGWAVRRDLVVTRTSGLRPPVTVILGARVSESLAVYERTVESDDGAAWTAAVLPEGTLPLDGELLPPGFSRLARSALPHARGRTGPGTETPAEAPAQVTRSIWCFLFPRIKGC